MSRRIYVCLFPLFLGCAAAILWLAWAHPAPAAVQERNCVAGPHSGTITANQTWCLEDAPHMVNGEVTIAAGVALTIEAGVEVRFSGVGLTVNGSLIAVGAEGQPVKFTSSAATPAPDDWTRLMINSGATARLNYCTIEYAGGGGAQSALELFASDVVIDHCTFQSNAGSTAAVRLLSVGMTPTLRNSAILNNSGYAIYQMHVDMAPTVQNLTFSGNTKDAFYIKQGYEGTITRAVTWDGGQLHGSPYIAENVIVSPSGQLTLGAGTTLRLTSNAFIIVQGDGWLNANGQPGQLVTITSLDASSYINRLQFDANSHGRLSYCDLSRGSSGQAHALRIASSDVVVEHCLIHDNLSNAGAVQLNGQGITPILRHTAIYNNVGYAIEQDPPDMAPTHIDLTLSGNGVDAVHITGGGTFTYALQRAVVWDGGQLHGSPFIAEGVKVAASGWLTLTAGTTLRVTSNALLEVQSEGRLAVLGNVSQPVTITSLNPSSVMGRLDFAIGSHVQLRYCDISRVKSAEYSALDIRSSDVLVEHCNIHDNFSSQSAVHLNGVGLTPTIRDTTIQNNTGYAIYHQQADMAPVYQNLVVSGNGSDAIVSYPGGLGTSRYWMYGQAGAPVQFLGGLTVPNGLYLALEPGTEMQFASGATLTVNGSLYLLGSPTQPITLTSIAGTPGSWGGVSVSNTGRALLNYCDLANGGQSGQALLAIATPQTLQPTTALNCRIHGSAGDGIKISNQSRPVLLYNQIEGNAFGLRNTTPATAVEARTNWWGEASGPFHATLNPGGAGNPVSDGVLFDPWLSSPQYSETPPGNQVVIDLGGPQRVSPGQTVTYSIWYSNLSLTTVQEAVLVLAVPFNAQFLSGTGGAIEWPQRHQAYWRLGDLEPGESGSLAVRLRYRWGIPDRTIDATQAMMVGVNYPHPPLVVDDYLNHQPHYALSQEALTQAQFDAVRATKPDLNELYTGLAAEGFAGGNYTQMEMNTDETVIRAVLISPDVKSVAFLVGVGQEAVSFVVKPDSLSLATAEGGITMTLVTEAGTIAGDEPRAPHLVVESNVSEYDCLLNCAIENVGMSILGEFFDAIGALQSTTACLTYAATGDPTAQRDCLLGAVSLFPGVGTLVAALDCYRDYKVDPNSCLCTADKWGPGKLFGQDACSKVPCNTQRGVYEASQVEYFICPFCEMCISGLGGSSNPWDHCRKCNEGPPEQCQPGAILQRTAPAQVSENPPAGDCRKNCLLIPRDPNALYGPEGEVIPGQWITYTITYENEGAGRAYGVYILDTLSDVFDDSTLTLNTPATYLAPIRTVLWSIGELGPKGDPDSKGSLSFRVQLRGDLPGGAIIYNQARVYFPSAPEVTPTNPWINLVQPVVALPQQVSTSYAQPVAITLHGLEVSGAPLSYQVVDLPLYGVLSGSVPDLTYTPDAGFVGLDRFTFQVNNGLMDSLAAEVQITVEPSAADSTPPEVSWTSPHDLQTGVAYQPQPILVDGLGPLYLPMLTIQFSEPLSLSTITTETFSLVDAEAQPIPIRLAYDSRTRQVTLAPTLPLHNLSWYTAAISTALKDLAGNSLATTYSWSFRTADLFRYLFLPQVFRP